MDRTRRRMVQAIGGSVAISLLAGCADEGEGDDPADFEEETGNGQDGPNDDEDTEDGGEPTGESIPATLS